jgi:hypothetical protein
VPVSFGAWRFESSQPHVGVRSVHAERTVQAALRLAAAGPSATDIASELRVPRRTVADWVNGSVPHTPNCAAGCTADHDFAALPPAYVHLLGLYLGDGSTATHPRGVYRLRVSLDLRYPDIIEQCVTAIGKGRAAQSRRTVLARYVGRSPLLLQGVALLVPSARPQQETRAANCPRQLAGGTGQSLAGASGSRSDPFRRV